MYFCYTSTFHKIHTAHKIDLKFWLYPKSISYNRMTNTLPYLPTELTNMIFDYKEAFEAKDKHNTLTVELVKSIHAVNDRCLFELNHYCDIETEEEVEDYYGIVLEDDEGPCHKSSHMLDCIKTQFQCRRGTTTCPGWGVL